MTPHLSSMYVYTISAIMVFPVVAVALLLANDWLKRHFGKKSVK